jgi:hypothetical protein
MSLSYYDTLPPVRAPGASLLRAVAGLRLPYRVLASIGGPAGPLTVAFVSDSALLSRMFAANWAPAGPGQRPDATLYALTRPARGYGLGGSWDGTRWWSPERHVMVVFGFGSYRLVKVCVRGMCSAVTGDGLIFLHGCALSVGAGAPRRGVVITGSSGAGKTTLVAGLLRHPELAAAVLNDDWGGISLRTGEAASTGEQLLHMKTSSVLALRPDFFTRAPPGSYRPDRSESDTGARLLVPPGSVYGTAWTTSPMVVAHVVVVVREPPGWRSPRRGGEAVRALESEDEAGAAHHHEAFFNGSLLLPSDADKGREERRYQRLFDRTTVTWLNNCGPPEALLGDFIAATSAALR